jgi:hypothetical protein
VIEVRRNGDRDGQESSVERGVATLDTKIAGTVISRGGTVPGKRMSMRKTREVPSVVFRVEAEATSDRPQRQRQPEHSARVPGAFPCGGIELAAAARHYPVEHTSSSIAANAPATLCATCGSCAQATAASAFSE